MKRLALIGLATFALLLPLRDAKACRVLEGEFAFIHSALPTPLPPGAVIAEVTFDPAGGDALYRAGVRVRVRRMIQGEQGVDTLIVRSPLRTSCDVPFANGTSGYLIGVRLDTEDGLPVVAPIRSARSNRFRLPDGYRIPEREEYEGERFMPPY